MAAQYLGMNFRGDERHLNSQPRHIRSAQAGILTWSPLRNPIAAPIQQMVGFQFNFSLSQSPSFSWVPLPVQMKINGGFKL